MTGHATWKLDSPWVRHPSGIGPVRSYQVILTLNIVRYFGKATTSFETVWGATCQRVALTQTQLICCSLI